MRTLCSLVYIYFRVDPICEADTWPGKSRLCGVCKVFVSLSNREPTRCEDYCGSIDRACVNAWQGGTNTCAEKYTSDCTWIETNPICECGSEKLDCKSHEYILGGKCKKCVYGSVCDGKRFTCATGYFRNAMFSGCDICPEGATCDHKSVVTCGEGRYIKKNATATTCAKCPLGATCKDGKQFECGSRFYLNNAKNACIQCPKEATCNGETLSKCSVGNHMIKTEDGATCAACPESSKLGCNGKTVTCRRSDEMYDFGDLGNVLGCIRCPTGATCNGKEIVSCGPGSFLGINGLDCKLCPEGASCDGLRLTTCGQDRYKIMHGQDCSFCPANTICNGNEASCGPGRYFMVNKFGSGKCENCPARAVCDGKRIVTCQKDRYKVNLGDECAKCPAGAACDGVEIVYCGRPNMYVNQDKCAECPTDFTCERNRLKYRKNGNATMAYKHAPILLLTDATPMMDPHTCFMCSVNTAHTCKRRHSCEQRLFERVRERLAHHRHQDLRGHGEQVFAVCRRSVRPTRA